MTTEVEPSVLKTDVNHNYTQEVLIEYVKEKDNLRFEVQQKDKEVQRYKAKVYDLKEEVGSLKKQVQTLLKQTARQLPTDNSSSSVSPSKLGIVRPTTGARTPVTKRAKSSKRKKAHKGRKNGSSPTGNDTPPDEKTYISALKTVRHLNDVAEAFPDLKLSVVLSSEKLFHEADLNNDGTIDEKELENLLMKQGHLFTNKELKQIMSEIDVDNNSTIDIMEYLAVIEKVQQRKRTNLPNALTKSSICAIQ